MPDNDTGSRQSRGSRKPSQPAAPDDWPSVAPASQIAEARETPPERQRIAKAMARAGLCSRRDAEAWILEGRVSVDGEVLKSPARDVGPNDRVEVDGAPLPAPERTRLFLFHKPRGLVTSDHDPEGRETVADYLREHWPCGPRVVTVGRLDINTEGLLLLTNDGGLARMLELPKTGWLRRYRVRANGETDQAKLDALGAGIAIEGVAYAGIEAKLDRVQGANCWLTMGLREGKNREIKRVLEHLGLEVNRLIRLSFGPFQLLDLPEGAVEEVRTRVLKDQLGVALAAEAGVDFGDMPVPPALAAEPAGVVKDKPARDTKAARAGTAREKRAGDPRPQQSRAAERLNGERPPRRRETPAVPTRDDRAAGQPRRHVSTLRTTEAEAARIGARKRIERSDTRDRHDRTIAVERKVSARPPRSQSPAAEGKRARIARSGAPRRDATRDANGGAPTRGRASFGRDARTRPDGGEPRARRVDERPRSSHRAGGDGGERASTREDARPRREGGATGRPFRPSGDGGGRELRSRREEGARDTTSRAGTRPPRRDGSGAGKPRGERPPSAARPAASQRPRSPSREDGAERPARAPGRAAPRGPRGSTDRAPGQGRPASSGKPGSRPSGGARPPGGQPPRGGAPGRTKR